MNAITVHAPAKVNLILKVVGRRPNGYHDLVMVMEKLKLHDEIVLEQLDRGIELVVDGQRDEGMVAQKNLAWRAAAVLQEAAGVNSGVRITLRKRTPVAAGLGGGSSDAAATLTGLNQLWDVDWSREGLAQLGSKLGADVPFFCFDGPALVEGIGDRVTPLASFPKLYILLINPGFAVSTPWVYGRWDELNGMPQNTELNRKIKWLTVDRAGVRVPPLFETTHDIVARLENDLEEATVSAHPEVAAIKEFLIDAGARGALMAGSGPTVFGIFEDAAMRDRAAAKVTDEAWRVFATEN